MEAIELIELIRLLEKKIDLLSDELKVQKKKEKLFGEWAEEQEIIALTNLSRGTLLKLYQEGHIERSKLSGKSNYYKLSSFKKLLDKNNT